MTTRFASFPIARSSSPATIADTFSVDAPADDGTNTNLLAVAQDSTRAYAIVRNNSPYQIVYGYDDDPALNTEGVTLNPSDTAVLTNKGDIYIRCLNTTNDADVRVDIGKS
jgi:hypothetical protein